MQLNVSEIATATAIAKATGGKNERKMWGTIEMKMLEGQREHEKDATGKHRESKEYIGYLCGAYCGREQRTLICSNISPACVPVK